MTRHIRLSRLADIAMDAVARLRVDAEYDRPAAGAPAGRLPAVAALARAKVAPDHADGRLVALAARLGFSDAELLAAALLMAVETQPEACRAIAVCQAPVGGPRPLVGLMAAAFSEFGEESAGILALAAGPAVRSGCIVLGGEDAPLPERSMAMPASVVFALCGVGAPAAPWRLLTAPEEDASLLASAAAAWAAAAPSGFAIVGCPVEDQPALAVAVARAYGLVALQLDGEPPADAGALLVAGGFMPVMRINLRPGEIRQIPQFGEHHPPWLCFKGEDGAVAHDRGLAPTFAFGPPDAAGRAAIWRRFGYARDAAAELAAAIRAGPGLIRRIAAAVGSGCDASSALEAARALPLPALDGLARRLPTSGAADGFIAPPALLAELVQLENHCRHGETAAAALGPAALGARRGVKALFHGPSGSGKSMAAEWLGARLRTPVHAVDLAAVTSKWIGETEKNIGQLLAAAEDAGALLFFDEADALFGARTEIAGSNDRFANNQTNFLLQRLDRHEGVVILATNSRDRVDAAFTRRFDAIVAFPMPDAPTRLAIWQAHLGAGAVAQPDLERLSVFVELSGGHIRNIAVSAAVAAAARDGTLRTGDLLAATEREYAKLGRMMPRELG